MISLTFLYVCTTAFNIYNLVTIGYRRLISILFYLFLQKLKSIIKRIISKGFICFIDSLIFSLILKPPNWPLEKNNLQIARRESYREKDR